MGIRETLNKNPAITTGATIAIIVVALIVIIAGMMPAKPKTIAPRKPLFTTDEGDTVFAGEPINVAPFEKDGQQAVAAHIFSCDGGKTTFVGYLEKLNDAGLKRYNALPRGETGAVDSDSLDQIRANYTVVKKPKTKEWVLRSKDEANEIVRPKCPHNDPKHKPVEVFQTAGK